MDSYVSSRGACVCVGTWICELADVGVLAVGCGLLYRLPHAGVHVVTYGLLSGFEDVGVSSGKHIQTLTGAAFRIALQVVSFSLQMDTNKNFVLSF